MANISFLIQALYVPNYTNKNLNIKLVEITQQLIKHLKNQNFLIHTMDEKNQQPLQCF